ncbi:MAG: hypothetical protein AAF743_01080 [Planctomycetota bacterium]
MAAHVLDQVLEPIVTPDAARKILEVDFPDDVMRRVDVLREKCGEGELTEEEQREYDEFIEASDLMMILRLRAMVVLKESGASAE